MIKFGKNVSNRVIAKIGKDDRRNGVTPQSTKGAYLKGYKRKSEGKRTFADSKEHIANDLAADGGELLYRANGVLNSACYENCYKIAS